LEFLIYNLKTNNYDESIIIKEIQSREIKIRDILQAMTELLKIKTSLKMEEDKYSNVLNFLSGKF